MHNYVRFALLFPLSWQKLGGRSTGVRRRLHNSLVIGSTVRLDNARSFVAVAISAAREKVISDGLSMPGVTLRPYVRVSSQWRMTDCFVSQPSFAIGSTVI